MSSVQQGYATLQRIAQIDQALEELRPEYERVKKFVGDEGYGSYVLKTLAEVQRTLDLFRAGDGGDKAIYLIGLLDGLLLTYKGTQQILQKHHDLLDRRKTLERTPG